MQGISIITKPTGEPSVMTIDFNQLDERLTGIVQKLLQEVEDMEATQERTFWYELGAQGLERAYCEDEPEYTEADLLTRNPDYEHGR
jgi:hypothetical protein